MKTDERIYGLYPGYIQNLDDLENMSPSEIFLAIRNYSAFIFNIQEFVQENVENVDLSEEKYTFDFFYLPWSEIFHNEGKSNQNKNRYSSCFVSCVYINYKHYQHNACNIKWYN